MKFAVASLLLASTALAVPMEQVKRDLSTEIVYTTVWTTTTIYVDSPTQIPYAEEPSSPASVKSSTLLHATTAAPGVSATGAGPVVSSVAAPVVPVASSAAPSLAAPVVSSVAPPPAAPVVSSAAPPPAAPVVSSAAPPPAAPVSSSTKAAAPVAAAEASVAAAPVVAVAAAAVDSHVGQATYYEVSNGQPGSCGILKSDSDAVVALSLSFMNNGVNPNKNPLCGKTINIQGETAVHTAVIYDSCAGCALTDVDLSPSLFKAAFPHGDGRVNNVKWWIS